MHSSYRPSTELLREFLRSFPSDELAPTLDELLTLVDVTFWASLRAEEGRPSRPALSFNQARTSLETSCFSETVPLSVEDLVQLSPVLRNPDVYAGVWRYPTGLSVWGLVLAPSDRALKVRATGPGMLRLSAGPHLVATLSGERAQLVAPDQAFQFNALLTRALGLTSDPWLRSRQNDYLRHVARRIRAHGRGGTLLVVPSSGGTWDKTLRFRHRFATPAEDIVNAWRDETVASQRRSAATTLHPANVSTETLEERANAILAESIAQDRARALANRIGDVTAVDGAAVATRELALLAFGAKIVTHCVPARILQIRPVVGAALELISLEMLGGTRHQSAAAFVTAQPDCIALVVSQDGVVSLFSWLEEERAVLVARELELLLWAS
jgi:hypothetical protein